VIENNGGSSYGGLSIIFLEAGLNVLIRCFPNITPRVGVGVYKETGGETGQVDLPSFCPVSVPETEYRYRKSRRITTG